MQLEGHVGVRSASTKVVCPSTSKEFDTDDLKEAVKKKFESKLLGVDATDLIVSDGENGPELKAGILVSQLNAGKDEDNPLLVRAPAGEPTFFFSCLCTT